jgi:hypothetical protein
MTPGIIAGMIMITGITGITAVAEEEAVMGAMTALHRDRERSGSTVWPASALSPTPGECTLRIIPFPEIRLPELAVLSRLTAEPPVTVSG